MNLDSHQAKLKHYRLNQFEYDEICKLLGRDPKGIEWALFSALWSEHCSYKSSRRHLKKFFFESPRVVESFGENAGVIDLGEGERVGFKMESHNHPSFIEPFQGAATGVGGILRDIFTMGARPIAIADYLCFGEPKAARMTSLVDGVVKGISHYGNCVGVPTISGQTEFHSSYDGNILVNAFALGLFRPGEPIVNSKARGEGNWVVYVGAKTGKDGVHGASMASESFDENSESKKPTIQIGDPFLEKLLIESCIEVMRENLVVAIQDMGAAGLTSSSFEMAAKGNVGLDLYLDKVPIRDSSIQPEEILLSESQERMLLICEPSKFEAIEKVFAKWGLDAAVVGEVKNDRKVRIFWKNEMLTDIDPHLLTENAPNYDRPYSPWKPKYKTEKLEAFKTAFSRETLLATLSSVEGCSREWIYRQYDQRVGTNTHRDATHSVAVLRLPDSGRALGIVLGCRPSVMRMDTLEGAKDAAFYPSLELAVKGFEPLALTDCLNFGNPEKPELMSELVATVEGLTEASKALKAPVISGNVSLYNETLNKNVTSTPSTGWVGLRPALENIPQDQFVGEGNDVYKLSLSQIEWNGTLGEKEKQKPQFKGEINSQKCAEFVTLCLELGRSTELKASKVVGKFGLPYALARMSLNNMGAKIVSTQAAEESFKERLYEIVLEVAPGSKVLAGLTSRFEKLGAKLEKIGSVTKGNLSFQTKTGETVDLSSKEMNEAYYSGWKNEFKELG